MSSMVDIHQIKEGDTLWYLEKDEINFKNVEFIIHEAKCTKKSCDHPPYGYCCPRGLIYSCDLEFYDENQMCYRYCHMTEHDFENQPEYDGRFFTNYEEAEECRIMAETFYIEKVLKSCYDATQLAKSAHDKIKNLLLDKGISDASLISACEKYFDSSVYNSNSILYNLRNQIEKNLKNSKLNSNDNKI